MVAVGGVRPIRPRAKLTLLTLCGIGRAPSSITRFMVVLICDRSPITRVIDKEIGGTSDCAWICASTGSR